MTYTFSINQNLYYPRLLLRENDKDSAIPVVDSSHLRYRNFVSDFRTALISLCDLFLRLIFGSSLKPTVCLTSLITIILFSDLLLAEEAYYMMEGVQATFPSLFTFLLNLGQTFIMIF